MSNFNVELDVLVAKIGEHDTSATHKILVNLRQYDGGDIKVEMVRATMPRNPKSAWFGKWRYGRMGRMTREEAKAVGALLLQAAYAEIEERPKAAAKVIEEV